jgi:hypothetical protein
MLEQHLCGLKHLACKLEINRPFSRSLILCKGRAAEQLSTRGYIRLQGFLATLQRTDPRGDP